MAICPSYYRRGNVEVWDFIRDQGLSYHLGNAVKYICRAGYKDSAIEDLTKAIHYLQNELEHVITEQPSYREQALRRVHRSNMSKLGDDGKPIYREDGKVLKGPNYQPPNLTDLV